MTIHALNYRFEIHATRHVRRRANRRRTVRPSIDRLSAALWALGLVTLAVNLGVL